MYRMCSLTTFLYKVFSYLGVERDIGSGYVRKTRSIRDHPVLPVACHLVCKVVYRFQFQEGLRKLSIR